MMTARRMMTAMAINHAHTESDAADDPVALPGTAGSCTAGSCAPVKMPPLAGLACTNICIREHAPVSRGAFRIKLARCEFFDWDRDRILTSNSFVTRIC